MAKRKSKPSIKLPKITILPSGMTHTRVLINGERKDVLDEVDIAFYNHFKELDEDQQETVRDMVKVMRERRSKKQE